MQRDLVEVDVAVVGAGLAGLVCAQRLRLAGQRVVVLEKSRGLGGRLATRRLSGTCADHGVRYLDVQGPLTDLLIRTLLRQTLLQPWLTELEIWDAGKFHSLDKPSYIAINGLTAVAKWLAADLEIRSGQRLHRLIQTDSGWQLDLEAQAPAAGTAKILRARSVVLAIPAPQALTLLEPLAAQIPDLIQALQTVQFDPCLTAIATYAAPASGVTLHRQAVKFLNHADLAWVSMESSKGRDLEIPTLVVQSSPEFAKLYLEADDLRPVGKLLIEAAIETLFPNTGSWLNSPTELQVHRWRYGLVHQPLSQPCLAVAQPIPLVCSGDWCGGSQLEAALASGLAAAAQTERLLDLAIAKSPETASPEVAFSALIDQLTAQQ